MGALGGQRGQGVPEGVDTSHRRSAFSVAQGHVADLLQQQQRQPSHSNLSRMHLDAPTTAPPAPPATVQPLDTSQTHRVVHTARGSATTPGGPSSSQARGPLPLDVDDDVVHSGPANAVAVPQVDAQTPPPGQGNHQQQPAPPGRFRTSFEHLGGCFRALCGASTKIKPWKLIVLVLTLMGGSVTIAIGGYEVGLHLQVRKHRVLYLFELLSNDCSCYLVSGH